MGSLHLVREGDTVRWGCVCVTGVSCDYVSLGILVFRVSGTSVFRQSTRVPLHQNIVLQFWSYSYKFITGKTAQALSELNTG